MAISFPYQVGAGRCGLLGRITVSSKIVFSGFSSGTDVFHSHDAVASNDGQTYTKVKTIYMGFLPAAVLLLNFKLESDSATTAYAKIYRNGVAVGTEQSKFNFGYESKTESIAGWSAGDTLELWVKNSGLTDGTNVKEFRILGSGVYFSNS